MANGDAIGSAANDVVELEAMRKDGFSWHPCQVSLCSGGLGLIVLYGNNSQEMITDKQEILARIRVRSTPLQGDDCSSIRQGDHVLASESQQADGSFYDARLEKVIHVRHSKRIQCRCSFTIKWLHHALPEEQLTVPASAIMKLATKNIHLHPTISAFFSSQEALHTMDSAPCLEIAEGELDINVLLEQQIKQISTSHVPQENILKGHVSGHTVDLGGQSPGWAIKASPIEPLGAITLLDKLNGFCRSENGQPMEMILEKPPVSTPSIQEELRGSRFLINPLAARAALASLRSEFPQTPEFSARSHDKGDMAGHDSVSNLPQGSKLCSFSAVDCSSNGEKVSLKISATLEGISPNLRSIAKKLFQTSSPSDIDETSNINGTEEKKTTVAREKRLNRSQIQGDNGMHGTLQLANNNETQPKLTGTGRVTRSRVKGAEKIEARDLHNEFTESETFPLGGTETDNCLSDNLKAVDSPINGQTKKQRVTRSSVKGVEKTEVNAYNAAVVDGIAVDVDTQQEGYTTQDAGKHNIPKRLTRSAASKDAAGNTAQIQVKRRKNESTESVSVNNGQLQKSSESSGGSRERTRQKSANTKKQETRFSPRLRFLQKTA